MKTEDLVTMLATGVEPVNPRATVLRYAGAVGAGAVGAVVRRRGVRVCVPLPGAGGAVSRHVVRARHGDPYRARRPARAARAALVIRCHERGHPAPGKLHGPRWACPARSCSRYSRGLRIDGTENRFGGSSQKADQHDGYQLGLPARIIDSSRTRGSCDRVALDTQPC